MYAHSSRTEASVNERRGRTRCVSAATAARVCAHVRARAAARASRAERAPSPPARFDAACAAKAIERSGVGSAVLESGGGDAPRASRRRFDIQARETSRVGGSGLPPSGRTFCVAMAEPSHAAAFCAAVATLHGSSDARAREEADRWLVSATTGAAAWDTCLPVLLAGPAVSPEARVVAASALARALRAGAFEGRLEEALSAARAAFSVAGDEPATSAAASALLAAAAIEADRETASLLDDGSRRDFVLCRGLVREAAARLVSGEAVGQPALPASPAALARLVAALAQEAPRLPATHRRVLARALGGVSREALATFEAARGAASLSFVAGALEAWAQACTDDGFPQSAAVAGASVLRASAPGLWNDLKQAALSPGSPSNDAAAAAAALVEAVRADATQSEEGSSSSAGADLAACVAAARATVAAREDEALAAAVSRVGSAIGDAWPEQCCTNEVRMNGYLRYTFSLWKLSALEMVYAPAATKRACAQRLLHVSRPVFPHNVGSGNCSHDARVRALAQRRRGRTLARVLSFAQHRCVSKDRGKVGCASFGFLDGMLIS